MEKGGVELTGQIWSIDRETRPTVTLSTSNTTQTGLELNPYLRDGMLFQTARRHIPEYNTNHTKCAPS